MSKSQIDSNQIKNGSLINEDISATAQIDGTKIVPSFGAQSITTSGNISITGPVGLYLGVVSGNPAVLAPGMIWFDTTTLQFKGSKTTSAGDVVILG